ncbi:MAG TPA: LuxR C-terminal-related transcriptional regulator [Microlunatus sp.]
MPGVHVAAESYPPSYLLARPAAPAHAIERPDTVELITAAVDTHRVVVVAAPAGYGKTTAVGAWARQTTSTVAWLSLTSSDKHPSRLQRGLISALEPVVGTGARDLAELLQHEVHDAVLVLDDVHVVGPEAAGVLGRLLDRAPDGLRIVLISRRRPLLRLQRINAAGGLGEVSIDQLAFSAGEVGRAAAQLGRPLSPQQATNLRALTAGWPVAVRLALMSAPTITGRLVTGGQLRAATLTDYLIEEVLGDLPTVLRDFLLRVSVTDWLTGRLAIELSGDTMAPAMLEDAITRGIPIERREGTRGEPVYRWHRLVADQCRALLRRRDPAAADELHLRAARFLAVSDPARAARHALSGRSPELAADILIGNWLSSALRGDFAVLEDVCRQLPAPWSDDRAILSVLAACRSAADDPARAEELRHRAGVLAHPEDDGVRSRYEVTALLADLLVADDGDRLVLTCRRVREVLTETSLLQGAERACAWFLVGFAEVRLRRTSTAVPALREAAVLCRAEQLDDIAGRALANLVFALAFNGDFAAAEGLLREHPGDDDARWRRIEGRPEWFAAGWMSFWRADLEGARRMFEKCIASGGAMTSYATMSRIWLVPVATAQGDPALLRTAEAGLAEVRPSTVQGLPLQVYKGLTQAQLALAAGQPQRAVDILDATLPGRVDIPATLVFAAEIYLSCGRPEAARACLTDLGNVDTLPGYAAVAAAVARALLADHDGLLDDAHHCLERALGLAVPHGVLRPFVRADPRLQILLADHAHRGTGYEELLATALARREEGSKRSLSGGLTLSAREREVLGYLQTGLSSTDIAAALFISANTLKTHQRAIYRKLGVSDRRAAAKAARDQ